MTKLKIGDKVCTIAKTKKPRYVGKIIKLGFKKIFNDVSYEAVQCQKGKIKLIYLVKNLVIK